MLGTQPTWIRWYADIAVCRQSAGSGNSQPDLVVFESGEIESVRVEISRDGSTFFDVGVVGGLANSLDIDAYDSEFRIDLPLEGD